MCAACDGLWRGWTEAGESLGVVVVDITARFFMRVEQDEKGAGRRGGGKQEARLGLLLNAVALQKSTVTCSHSRVATHCGTSQINTFGGIYQIANHKLTVMTRQHIKIII